MSIEVSQGASQSQSTGSSTDARVGKGKGGAAGGFTAILDALSDDVGTAATAATAASGLGALGTAAGSSLHPGSAATPGADALTSTVPDAATLLALNPQVVNPQMLAQPLGQDQALGALPAQSGGVLAEAIGQQRKGVVHARPAQTLALQSQESSEALGAKRASDQASVAQAKASLNTDPNAANTNSNSNSNSNATGSDSERAGAADPRNDKLMAAITQLQSAQSNGATTAVAGAAPLVAQAGNAKPGADRSATAAKASDSSYGTPNLNPTPANYTTTASGAASAAPEAQVAEQVKFWISQDVQHAQMKLDGLGKDPVQVSITMNGNQASIAFQTDESQTRGVLEHAAAHLKDVLGREGVVLAGVSIGSSTSDQSSSAGANGSGSSGSGGEQRARQSARQSVMGITAAVSATTRANQSVLPAGRSLDLFV